MSIAKRLAAKWHIRVWFVFLSCLTVPCVHAEPVRNVEAIITKVSDGNTVQAVTPDKKKLKIRLYGIDAPEAEIRNKRNDGIDKPGQPYGGEAKDYLTSMILDKKTRVEIIRIDRHKRVSAIIWIGKHNVSLEMIKAGMAEAYVEHLDEPYLTHFLTAEKKAKAKGRGIWSQGKDYVRPSVFRRKMKARAG